MSQKYFGNLPQPIGTQKMALLKLANTKKTSLASEIANWQQEEIARRVAAGDNGLKKKKKPGREAQVRTKRVLKIVAPTVKLVDFIAPTPESFDQPNISPYIIDEMGQWPTPEPVAIIKEDVEGPRIPPFIQVRLFKHFKKHGIEQTLEAVEVYHKKAMNDPEEFKEIYGPDLTNLIIQL